MTSTLDAVAYGGSGASPPPLGISTHKEGPLSEASWLVWFRCHPGPIAAPPMIAARGGQADVSLIRRGGEHFCSCFTIGDPPPGGMGICTQLLLRIVKCESGRFSRFFLQLIFNSRTPRAVRLYQVEIPMPVGVCQFLLSFVNVKLCKVYNSSSSFVTVQMY